MRVGSCGDTVTPRAVQPALGASAGALDAETSAGDVTQLGAEPFAGIVPRERRSSKATNKKRFHFVLKRSLSSP